MTTDKCPHVRIAELEREVEGLQQRLAAQPVAVGQDGCEIVYRWLALDNTGYVYGSNPPPLLPKDACLKAFYSQEQHAIDALHEIAGMKNVTATWKQYAEFLQRTAREALTAPPAQAMPVVPADLLERAIVWLAEYDDVYACDLEPDDLPDLRETIAKLRALAANPSRPYALPAQTTQNPGLVAEARLTAPPAQAMPVVPADLLERAIVWLAEYDDVYACDLEPDDLPDLRETIAKLRALAAPSSQEREGVV